MLPTAETREVGASVMAHLSPSNDVTPVPVKKSAEKKNFRKEDSRKAFLTAVGFAIITGRSRSLLK